MENYEFIASPDEVQLYPETGNRQEQVARWRRFVAACGCLATAYIGASAVVDAIDSRSGTVIVIGEEPAESNIDDDQIVLALGEDGTLGAEASPVDETSKTDDGEAVFITLNTAGWITGKGSEAENTLLTEIAAMADAYNPDVFMFQELSHAGAKEVKKILPKGSRARYVIAENFPRPGKEEFGNMIVTWETPQDVDSVWLHGSPKLQSIARVLGRAVGEVWDAVTDQTTDITWSEAGNGWKEHRAAIEATAPVRIGDEIYYIQSATTHLDKERFSPEKAQQFRQLNNFAENTPEGVDIQLLAGDLNAEPENVVHTLPAYEVVLNSEPTHNSGATIDLYLVNMPEGLEAYTRVLKKYKGTDHDAVMAVIRPVQPELPKEYGNLR